MAAAGQAGLSHLGREAGEGQGQAWRPPGRAEAGTGLPGWTTVVVVVQQGHPRLPGGPLLPRLALPAPPGPSTWVTRQSAPLPTTDPAAKNGEPVSDVASLFRPASHVTAGSPASLATTLALSASSLARPLSTLARSSAWLPRSAPFCQSPCSPTLACDSRSFSTSTFSAPSTCESQGGRRHQPSSAQHPVRWRRSSNTA